MKLLAFILAFWMLALNGLPCGDATCGNAQEETTKGKHQTHKDPCDDSEEDDGCSPFCSCNCCGTIAYLLIKPLQPGIKTALIKKIPATITQKTIQASAAIWQPPKQVDAQS